MAAEPVAALTRPLTRSLLVVAGAAGAWAAVGQAAAVRVDGALGGWQTAAASAPELALLLTAVAAAVAGSTARRLRLDELAHAAGVAPARRQRRRAATGAVTGVAVLAAFSAGAATAGALAAALAGSSWWATPGYDTGGPTELATFAVRLALGCALLGAGATLAGHLVEHDAAAGTVAAALSVPFLTVAGGVAGRSSGVLAVLALTPVGALRAALLGQQGLTVPGLETPAAVWPQAATAAAWLLLVAGLDARATARRPLPAGPRFRRPGAGRGTAGAHHRQAAGTTATARRSTRTHRPTAPVVGRLVLVAATVAVAVVVPPRVNEHLPWRWQPAWRAASRSGHASHQVVAGVVADVRAGRPPPAGVPDGVVTALRRGDRIEVAPVSGLRSPDEVPVLVAFDAPVATGDVALDAVLVRFVLAPDDAGWHVVGADGPFAAQGTVRPPPEAGP